MDEKPQGYRDLQKSNQFGKDIRYSPMENTSLTSQQLKKPVDGKKRPVEVRKSVASFVHFLKNTSRYYRDHIFKLASNFQIHELAPVLFDELKLKGECVGLVVWCKLLTV